LTSSGFTSLLARRALAPTALALVAAVALSACGSSATTSTASTAAAAVGGGAATGTSSARYQARLKYAKCMRAHGVNVPDPTANGGPAGGAAGAGAGGGFRALRSSPNFAAASTACAKYRSAAFGFANITPAQRAQFQQELVKFAECMRSHGVDIPDPSASAGGGFGILRSIPSSQRQSPAFQTALKGCSSTLPRLGRGAGGAGAGPPGGGAAPGA
jgi:hypothetical protein